MSIVIIVTFLCGACLRLILNNKISLVNERRLKSNNAKEYGKKNSLILIILHYLFFGGCLIEAYIRKTQFDYYTIVGLVLYVFSYIMLIYVIRALKGFWTNKVLIAEEHELNTSFLFKYIKHPNYFLNLLPEFIGFALICKALYVSIVILPLFCIALIIRIRIEEKALKAKFINY